MSNSVVLQFEEASQEAVLLAEALGTVASGATIGTRHGRDAAFTARIYKAWRWLNTPISLTEIAPEPPGGIIRRL